MKTFEVILPAITLNVEADNHNEAIETALALIEAEARKLYTELDIEFEVNEI